MFVCATAIVLAAGMTPPCQYVGLTSDARLGAWVRGWCEVEVHYNYTRKLPIALGTNPLPDECGARILRWSVEGANGGQGGLDRRCFLAGAAYAINNKKTFETNRGVHVYGLSVMHDAWNAAFCRVPFIS